MIGKKLSVSGGNSLDQCVSPLSRQKLGYPAQQQAKRDIYIWAWEVAKGGGWWWGISLFYSKLGEKSRARGIHQGITGGYTAEKNKGG